MKVVLKDGTTITGCTDSTSCNGVYIKRNNFANAGVELDKINSENVKEIKVYNDEDELIDSAVDLVFSGYFIDSYEENGVVVVFTTRAKTNEEKMQDEIAELQEAIIGN